MAPPTTTKQWTIEGKTGFESLKLNEKAPVPQLGDKDVLVKSTSSFASPMTELIEDSPCRVTELPRSHYPQGKLSRDVIPHVSSSCWDSEAMLARPKGLVQLYKELLYTPEVHMVERIMSRRRW